MAPFELLGQYQSKLSIWKKLAEGRRNNEFFSEFLKNVPKNVKFNNSENVDGDFVRELMIFSIYLVIQDTNTVLNRNTYDLTDFLYKIAENSWWNEKYFLENIAIELFTHQLWDVCLVTSILYRFPYGRVQGDQDHFFPKEMLISPSILKLHKNPWIWEGLRTIHFI